MSILYPHSVFHRIYEIPSDYFASLGVTTLLLDVDNTLTHDNHPEPDPSVMSWLDEQRSAGLRLMILSNNVKRRVAPFADKLGLGYIACAAKPLPMNLRRALAQMEVMPDKAAIIGDQIFTDILCGRLTGCHTVMVEPFGLESNIFFRLKRTLEKQILLRYRKKEK